MTTIPFSRDSLAVIALIVPAMACAATSGSDPQETADSPAATVDDTASGQADASAQEGTKAPAGPARWSRIRFSPSAADMTPRPDKRGITDAGETSGVTPPDDEDGEFVMAPIPFANPTIGAGLALGAAYLVKLDPDSPPSTIGGGAMYSENDSYALGFGFKGYLDGDRYRVNAAVAKGRMNFDLVSNGVEVPLQEDVVGANLEVLVRSFERVYIGPTVILFGVDTSIRRAEDEGAVPPEELKADNYGFGLHALRDTRDSTFYPRSGSLADTQFRTFVPALGNEFSYRVVPLSYNHFFSLGERDVLALRAAGRLAIGDVPFYGQSYLGAGPDLRGYAVGTVADDVLLAVQAEYRRELFWRLGAVGFAGVGTVLPALDEWDDAVAYPSAGFGLRLLLEEENHVNFRVDFAWGRDQSAIYVGVGEAF